MTSSSVESPPEARFKKTQINFKTLYRKFKFKVVRHFALTILRVILGSIIFGAIIDLFRTEGLPSNYANLLIPKSLQKFSWTASITIGKNLFITIGLLLVLTYAFVYYWDYVWEEELKVKGECYTKNLLLDKFRRLPFEEKQAKKDEVNKLIESDSWEVGHRWEHLPNHMFHCALEIIIVLIFYWGSFLDMSIQQFCFSIFWLILLNLITYFFTRKILRNEKRYKKKLDKEWAVINKERSNINLIENMGLTAEYEEKQKKITQTNENLILNYNRTKSLSKTIPSNLLMESFPFLLLFLSGEDFDGIVLGNFWRIFNNFGSIFRCLWDYADYSSSRSRINAFLTLPEKNDNLKGIKLASKTQLKAIHFKKVVFTYSGQTTPIECNRTFTSGQINYLAGPNGTGKSTLFYLLLGVLTPQSGKIVIETTGGKKYNLHQELNLEHWRVNQVVYCSHETLVEKGSTGQKQLANLEQTLKTKKNATLFLFDEADNALDHSNREKFTQKMKELSVRGVVIYIRHD